MILTENALDFLQAIKACVIYSASLFLTVVPSNLRQSAGRVTTRVDDGLL